VLGLARHQADPSTQQSLLNEAGELVQRQLDQPPDSFASSRTRASIASSSAAVDESPLMLVLG
jgi:hypothetical protein